MTTFEILACLAYTLATAISIVSVYWKFRMDFIKLKTFTVLEIKRVEAAFKDHCENNRKEFETQHNENREEHHQIFTEIKDFRKELMDIIKK